MRPYLRLLGYLRPYWPYMLVTWVMSVLILVSQGAAAWVSGSFVEQLLVENRPEVSHRFGPGLGRALDELASAILSRSTPLASLAVGVGIIVGAGLLTAIFRVAKLLILALVNQSVLCELRREMFAHLTELDLLFSRRHRPGETASLFLRDVDQLNFALIDAMDRLFMQPLRLLMVLVLMVIISPGLTAILMGFLVVSGAAIYAAGDRVESLSARSMKEVAGLHGHLGEYLSSAILAKTLGREKVERERFARSAGNLRRVMIQLMMVDAIAPQVVNVLLALSLGVLLFLGGYWVFVARTMSGGDLVRMMVLLPMAAYPFSALGSLYTSIRASVASARRVFALLDQPAAEKPPSGAVELDGFHGSISLSQVSCLIEGNLVLDRVTLTIGRGSTVVVFGPSGAGKTTLLGVVAGIVSPTSGSVQVDGVDLRRIDPTSWRRLLGVVTQDPILLNGTVRDNLRYAAPDADDAAMAQALEQALLLRPGERWREGLDTFVGNRGELVSGGERQRIAIARALLKGAEVLLMDEPTSMLDQQNKALIAETINSVAKARTVLVVAHDESLRALGDVAVELSGGRITATATA